MKLGAKALFPRRVRPAVIEGLGRMGTQGSKATRCDRTAPAIEWRRAFAMPD